MPASIHPQVSPVSISTTSTVYEQPLNEQMRLYLRLERLFNRLKLHRGCHSEEQSRLALESLLMIANLADRPDMKTKLIQTLNQQTNTLSQLAEHPEIDFNKLVHIQKSIHELTQRLHHSRCSKLVEALRKSAFLASIRLQLGNPAGVCDSNVPAYTLWLSQSAETKKNDLSYWAKETETLEQAIRLILQLIRESDSSEPLVANRFYHKALDPSQACQMVRLSIPNQYRVYPEISLSKHRLAIQFKRLNVHHPEDNSPNPELSIQFFLSCCRL